MLRTGSSCVSWFMFRSQCNESSMLNFCWFCFLAVFIHHFQFFVCLNFLIFQFSVAAWVPTRQDCLSFMVCLDCVHSIHTFSCSLFRIVSHDVSFPEKMDTWLIDQPYRRATTEDSMPKYAGCGYRRRLFYFAIYCSRCCASALASPSSSQSSLTSFLWRVPSPRTVHLYWYDFHTACRRTGPWSSSLWRIMPLLRSPKNLTSACLSLLMPKQRHPSTSTGSGCTPVMR